MKEVPIEGSNDLKLVRKGRKDFAIIEGESAIIELPRIVGRRVWLAMFAESKTKEFIKRREGKNGYLYELPFTGNGRKLSKLRDFFRKSNCHGTSFEITKGTGEISTKGWNSTIGATELRPISSLDEHIKTFGLPFFIHDDIGYHSAVIIGRKESKDNGDSTKFIIFEKVGFGLNPFKISVKTLKELSKFIHYLPYIQK